jgi:hypothetical protein
LKRLFLVAGIVLLVLSIGSILISISIPAQVKQDKALVTYNQTGKFAYLTYIKPSHVYGPAPQPPLPNPRYPLAAIGTIDFSYNFNPASSRPASSSVEAVLENPGIWQRRITLVPETSVSSNATLSFSLDPNRMNGIFEAVEKDTGITDSQRDLVINVRSTSGSDTFVQSLPLTLGKNVIEVSNNLNQSLPQGKGMFNYTVNRKSPPAVIPPAGKYPVEIVNSLDFTYAYQTADSKPAKVSVDAVMENSGVWQKTVNLLPAVTVGSGTPLSFSLSLDNLQNQFIDIDTQTKITTAPRLVTIKATARQGNDSIVQILPLTIDKEVLEVPGELKQVQSAGTGVFDYLVNLKPNSIYDTATLRPPQAPATAVAPLASTYDINLKPGSARPEYSSILLGPDQTVFTKLIDNMNVTFNYQFQADQPVNNLNTDVDITAVIEAPKVWSRTYPLAHTSKSGNFNLSLPLDMASYMALLQAVRTETGVTPDSYNISVTANLHTTGDTIYGKINETFNPTMKGTITNNILQWNKDLIINLPGSIITTTTVPNPQKILGLSAVSIGNLCGILSVVFLVLCCGSAVLYIRIKPARTTRLEKEALRIKKRYGTRLIASLNHGQADGERVIPLGSVEDLIRLADELAKPVIYQEPSADEDAYLYFVTDGTTRYLFALKPELKAPEPLVEKRAN